MMLKTKRKRLYLLFGLCLAALVAAAVWLVLRGPLFAPWRLYYDEGRVAELGAQDSFHATAATIHGDAESGFFINVGRFSGARTLCTLTAGPQAREMAITWDFALTAGHCKLVLVDTENNTIVFTVAEPAGSFQFTLPPGAYSLKLLGARASFTGEVSLR